MPSSLTDVVTRLRAASSLNDMETRPPAGLYFTALSTRLARTWRTLSRSARTLGRVSAEATVMSWIGEPTPSAAATSTASGPSAIGWGFTRTRPELIRVMSRRSSRISVRRLLSALISPNHSRRTSGGGSSRSSSSE